MPVINAAERGAVTRSTQWHDGRKQLNNHKVWDPILKCLVDSAFPRDSPHSPVSSRGTESPDPDRNHHIPAEIKQQTNSSIPRVPFKPYENNVYTNRANSRAISPPARHRPTESENSRPSAEAAPVDASRKPTFRGDSYRPSYRHSYDKPRPSIGVRKSVTPSPRAYTPSVYEPERFATPGMRIKGAAVKAKLVPAETSLVEGSVETVPLTKASLDRIPQADRLSMGPPALMKTNNPVSSNAPAIMTTLSTPSRSMRASVLDRQAVAGLAADPTFRESGTPFSEITNSSKSAVLRNICRTCNQPGTTLEPLYKCSKCNRQYHQAHTDTPCRTTQECETLTCKKCAGKADKRARKTTREPSVADIGTRKDKIQAATEIGTDNGTARRSPVDPKEVKEIHLQPEASDIEKDVYHVDSMQLDNVEQHASPPTGPAADRRYDHYQPDYTQRRPSQISTNHTEPPVQHRIRVNETNNSNRGDIQAENIHFMQSPPVRNHSETGPKVLQWAQLVAESYKTISCPWWEKQACHRDEKDCIFAHNYARIKTPSGRWDMNKDWTCRNWKKFGSCSSTDDLCSRAHYDTGLYEGPDGRPSRKFETCHWWYWRGHCKKSDEECPHSHCYTGYMPEDPASKPGGDKLTRPIWAALPTGRSQERRNTDIDIGKLVKAAETPSDGHRPSDTQIATNGQSWLSQDTTLHHTEPEQIQRPTQIVGNDSKTVDPRLARTMMSKNESEQARGKDVSVNMQIAESASCPPFDGITEPGITPRSPVTAKKNGLGKCKICSKPIFGARQCTTCQSTRPSDTMAITDTILDETDLSALVAEDLAADDADSSEEDEDPIREVMANRPVPAQKVIKRKATSERLFQPNKRHKPDGHVSGSGGKNNLLMRTTTSQEDDLCVGASIKKITPPRESEHALRAMLAQDVEKATDIVDLRNIRPVIANEASPSKLTSTNSQDIRTLVDKTISRHEAESEQVTSTVLKQTSDQRHPGFGVGGTQLTSYDLSGSERTPAPIKENTPLWSPSTEESEAEDLSAWVKSVPQVPTIASTLNKTPFKKKVACGDCSKRHRRCTHNTDNEFNLNPEMQIAIEADRTSVNMTQDQRGSSSFVSVSAEDAPQNKECARGVLKWPKSIPVRTSQTVCPICNQFNSKTGTGEAMIRWINCEAPCDRWFHISCAGFSDYETVEQIAVFICKDCEPVHGPTKFHQVRKAGLDQDEEDLDREEGEQSATEESDPSIVSGPSAFSRSTETPATSVTSSLDGRDLANKNAGMVSQRLSCMQPRALVQYEPDPSLSVIPDEMDTHDETYRPITKHQIDEDYLSGVLERLKLRGIGIDSDDSSDDSEDDHLPQLFNPPHRSQSELYGNALLPSLTYGQGMKNKDGRAVLKRSMLRNSQLYGNKHYSRQGKDQSVQVEAIFERKIPDPRHRFAPPVMNQVRERADFSEFLGLPKDVRPEPCLGSGGELLMRNQDASEHMISRKRRVRANETWPIRAEA